MSSFPDIRLASPFSESMKFTVLISTVGSSARETRKLRSLYPRRVITLQYENLSLSDARQLWQFYQARNGSFDSFAFFYPRSDSYIKEYVGTGDGSTVTFDLPSKDATSRSVYIDNVLQSSGFTFTSEAGTDGEDILTFTSAPTTGQKITFSFTGYLKLRARFLNDSLDFDTFYRFLTTLGLKLQGLLNDE